MKNPKVSVVIPSYNTADYIVAAIESVFDQSYSDYEIIVIDDGSTDNLKEVLEPYMDRIRYHYQENKGLAGARNTGMRLANGEYITYLDADDIWLEDNLQIKCNLLDSHPDVDAISSDFCVFNNNGIMHERGITKSFPFFRRTQQTFADIFSTVETITTPKGNTVRFYYGNIFDKLIFGNFILPTSVVYRKSSGERTGEYREELRNQEDYEYWLRYTQHCSFGYVDEVLAKYRRHSKQLTDHSKIEEMFTNIIGIVRQYKDYLYNANKHSIYNKRMADLLVNFSKVQINKNDKKKARELLFESLTLNRFQLEAYISLIISFLPLHLVTNLRKLKSDLTNEK